MSALHRMHDEQGADAPAVWLLLGLRSLARRIERDTTGEPVDATPATLDAPGLVLLGLMSLARGWRRVTAAAFDAADTSPPDPIRPAPSPPAPRTLLR